MLRQNLNTSYVDIKLIILKDVQLNISNLNTSYVDIKHESILKEHGNVYEFKYILC